MPVTMDYINIIPSGVLRFHEDNFGIMYNTCCFMQFKLTCHKGHFELKLKTLFGPLAFLVQ